VLSTRHEYKLKTVTDTSVHRDVLREYLIDILIARAF